MRKILVIILALITACMLVMYVQYHTHKQDVSIQTINNGTDTPPGRSGVLYGSGGSGGQIAIEKEN